MCDVPQSDRCGTRPLVTAHKIGYVKSTLSDPVVAPRGIAWPPLASVTNGREASKQVHSLLGAAALAVDAVHRHDPRAVRSR
jgi:hypothetical protein